MQCTVIFCLFKDNHSGFQTLTLKLSSPAEAMVL